MTLEDFLPALGSNSQYYCQYVKCKEIATKQWAGMVFCAEHASKLEQASEDEDANVR